MTFGKRLKKARTAKRMTQKQLASMLSVKHNSISNWENDVNKPAPATVELICGILEISPNYLLARNSDEFSPAEKLLIKQYRRLDAHGCEMVDFVLSKEHERCTADSTNTTTSPVRLINYYYRLASAGTGQILFDMPPTERIEIPDLPQYHKVDYAIGVNGDSMQPTYYDGDMLLVEMTNEIEIGEIGIFSVDGDCYVKKLGNGELLSLNKEYDNIPLNETAKCMGRVIDKL